MAIKVPELQETVSTVAPQTRAVTVGTPRLAQPRQPGVVPGAFKSSSAETLKGLGQVGQQIASNLLRMDIDNQDKDVAERETNFRLDVQNILNNPDNEEVGEPGSLQSRPIGILRRELSQAEGSTTDYDSKFPDLKKKYLDGLSKYQFDKLSPAMDRYYVAQRNRVITHESNQRNADIVNAVNANIAQKTLDASTIRDPDQLKVAIGEMQATAQLVNRKFDPATQLIKNEKIAADITMAAVNSTLENSGLEEAQALLASIGDIVSPGVHESLEKSFKKNLKAYQALKESEMIDLKINDQLTVARVIQERDMKHISAKTAQTLIKSLSVKPDQDTFSKTSKYNELVERNAALNKKERSLFFLGEVTFEEAVEFKADVLDANSKGLITDIHMKDLLGDTSSRFYGEPVFQDALNQLAAQSSLYAVPAEQSRAKAEMYESLTRKVADGTKVDVAVNEVISEKLSADVERAVVIETEREQTSLVVNPAVQTKITNLQKTMSNDEIKGFLREKNINPDNYEF